MNESCFIFRKQSITQSFKLNLYGLGKAGKMFTFCVYQQVVLNYCWSMYHALQAAFSIHKCSGHLLFCLSASAVCFFWQHNLSSHGEPILWAWWAGTCANTDQQVLSGHPENPIFFPCDWLTSSPLGFFTGALGEAIWVAKSGGGSLRPLAPSCLSRSTES